MRISACVIAKNEENNIENCLSSLRTLVDEIVVVDTGSTDNTVLLARKYGARVFFLEWEKDFSKAKNFALSKAKGDWIIFLDADEYLTKESIENIPYLLKVAEQQSHEAIQCLLNNIDTKYNKVINTHVAIRIFKNTPFIKYKGKIHEYLYHSNRALKVVNAVDVVSIIHTGYTTKVIRDKNKGDRNLDILMSEYVKNPKDSDICFYISESHYLNKNYKEALLFALKVLEIHNSQKYGVYQKNYSNIIDLMLQLNFSWSNISKIIKEAVERFPDFPDFYIFLGDLYKKENRYHDSIEAYNMAIVHLKNISSSQSRAHLNLDKVFGNLGNLNYSINNFRKSVEYYIESLKFNKFFVHSAQSLIKTLSQYESTDSVFKFLAKLYNFSDMKELSFLYKISLSINNKELANTLEGLLLLDESINSSDTDSAKLYLLNGEYEKAAEYYGKLYINNIDEKNTARMLLLIGLVEQNIELLELYSLPQPYLNIGSFFLNNKIIDGVPEEIELITTLFKDLITLNYIDFVIENSEKIKAIGLLFEVAEILHYNEDYSNALIFYNEFLSLDIEISNEYTSKILVRMSDCLRHTDENKLAEAFIDDAIKLNPTCDFYLFEIWIDLRKRNGRSTLDILEKAIVLFPDSNYIKQEMKKYGHTFLDEKSSDNTIDLIKVELEGEFRKPIGNKLKIVILGVTNLAINIENIIDATKAEIIAYASNDNNFIGNKINNIPVVNVEELIIDYDFLLIMDNSINISSNYKNLNLLKFIDDYYDFEIYRSFSKFLNNDKRYDGFITGLSYHEVGIDEKYTLRKTLNLANSSQDLFFDFEIAKYLLSFEEFNESIEYAIIGLSPYSFEYDLSLSDLKDRVKKYYPFLKKAHHYKNIKDINQNYDDMHTKIKMIFEDDYKSRLFYALKEFSEQQWEKLISGTLTEERLEKGKELVLKDCNKNYPQTVKENTKILREYIKLLQMNNIKPILVVCPTSRYYYNNFSGRIKNEFEEIVSSVCNEFDIQLLDYFESDLFYDEDFYDVSHLNKSGAKKFTFILNEAIEKLLK